MTDEKMPRRLRISRVGDEVEINSTDPLVSMDGCKYAAADYILATDYDTLRELARFGVEARAAMTPRPPKRAPHDSVGHHCDHACPPHLRGMQCTDACPEYVHATRLAEVEAQLKAERENAERLAKELEWCSGSADFGEGGQARLGWGRGPVEALTAHRKLKGEK